METKKVLIWAVVIALLVGLVVVAVLFREKINPNYEITTSKAKEDVEVLNDLKKGLNDLAKGGYTIEQSKTMQADADCPTQNDQYFSPMWCVDYDNIVMFSYKVSTSNGVIYPNIVFKRVGQSLSLDGIMNATLVCKRGGFLSLGGYNWKKAYVKIDFSKPTPAYNYVKSSLGKTRYDNYLSITSTDLYYWNDYTHDRNLTSPSSKEISLAREFVSKALLDTVQNYFLNFGNLRLQTQTAKGADVYYYLNSYFAYLYNSCKDKGNGNNSVINVSEFLTYDIPDDEQKNYPIPESKKADYPSDWEYYKMYKCDKYVRISYLSSKLTEVKTKTPSQDYIDNIQCEVIPAQEKKYVYQLIRLRNYNSADLSYYDATANPVQIDFIANDEEKKTVIFNDKNQFSAGVNLILASGKTYNYKITSNVLYFENIEGSFVAKDYTSLVLNFNYYSNASMCTFGLNAIGSIDFTQIDLSEHPVTVTFSTGQSIVWNSNDSFDTRQSVLLSFGEIEYTILSDALTFATATGKFTVDTSTRTILFNCAGVVQSDIVLSSSSDTSINVSNMTLGLPMYTADYLALYGDDSQYTVSVYLYDGETQYTLSKSSAELWPTASIGGGGTSGGNGYTVYYTLPSDLVVSKSSEEYHIYKLQVKISNGSNVYLSNLLDFKRYDTNSSSESISVLHKQTYIGTLQFNITL